MNVDITPIIEIIISLLAAIITAFVIPWIHSKTNANQWGTLNKYAKIFVKCAEQIFRGSGLGKDKKKYVQEKLTEIADEHGLDFSTDTKNQLKIVQKIKRKFAYMIFAQIFCLQFYWFLV